MKFLLLNIYKIFVVIHFDYTTIKAELKPADAIWVKNTIDSSLKYKINPSFNKQIHGYESGYIEFIVFDSESSSRKIKLEKGRIDTFKNCPKNFEYELIDKILNYNKASLNINQNKKKRFIDYSNHKFQQTVMKLFPIGDIENNIIYKFDQDTMNWDLEHNRRNFKCFNWAIRNFKYKSNDIDNSYFRCDSITKILIENKFIFLSGNYYKNTDLISLFVGVNRKGGFHFISKDSDESFWTHKDGENMPSKLDYNYNLIYDLKNAHTGKYRNFCGYFVIPKVKSDSFNINPDKIYSRILKAGTKEYNKEKRNNLN